MLRTVFSTLLAAAFIAVVAHSQTDQNQIKVKGTIKLVDQTTGKFLLRVPSGTGYKFVEYRLDNKTKFLDKNGKKIEGGFKNKVFASPNNRPSVNVELILEKVNGKEVLKAIRVK
ncbi:MAG: hypothetical protein KatS3mg105_4012 [Gemmatales bacterium]|nr:MAG: hypothetical protein KatS3mg105_4012 [Gemmatales bacterium]